jgi:hypothetical protein
MQCQGAAVLRETAIVLRGSRSARVAIESDDENAFAQETRPDR